MNQNMITDSMQKSSAIKDNNIVFKSLYEDMCLTNLTSKQSILEQAMKSDNQLTEYDIARFMNFTDEEIKMINLYWHPTFNGSWIYLSDEMILEYLTNETKKDALRHFYDRILLASYEEGIDYKEVLAEHELVKF